MVDVVRGLALVWMTGYHFCFDLHYFGWLQADFYRDAFWTVQRTAIVSLFLVCAGWSQALAMQQCRPLASFWRRWSQILACALAVSGASWIVFPDSFIYFGVLHGMAIMLLAIRLLPLSPAAWLGVAAVAMLAPELATQLQQQGYWMAKLDTRSWNWIGLISHKPITEDYVPLLPWLGVMACGLVMGHAMHSAQVRGATAASDTLQRGRWATASGMLAFLGRHSLSYYMLHQPILLGGLMLVRRVA